MSLSRTVFAGVLASAAGFAPAAVFGPITFTNAGDYTNNFVYGTANKLFSHDATGGTLQFKTTDSASGTSIVRYQTSASPAGPKDFLKETLSLDVKFNVINGTSHSAGVLTRIQDDNTGILALVNTGTTGTAGSTIQLRLFQGANATTNSPGTTFFNQTFTLTGAGANPIAANSSLKLILTQSSGDDPVFNLTVRDTEGLVATTGDQKLDTTDAYNGAGGVALRGSSAYPNVVITMDNFSATVPEPASALSLGALASGLLLRRRRR